MPHNLDQDRDRPRRPAVEPEILPPGQPDPRRPRGHAHDSAQIWASVDAGGGQRIFIAKPGPFAFILALLGVGAAVAIVLLLLLGLFVLWLPIIGTVVAGVILLRLLGGPKRRWP